MEVRVASTIEAFGGEAWNRLFPGELENCAYYRAIETSGLPQFELLYFGAYRDGELRAAVPAFITYYEVDTTVTGPARRVTQALARVLPRILRPRMLALGSPLAEICHLGFAADVAPAEQARLLDLLFDKAEEVSAQRGVQMIAAKDAPAHQDALWARVAAARGMRRLPGLPTALLDVRFASVEEYLASLSRATRKDLKRKLKAGAGLRVEWRDNIDDISEEVQRLYAETYHRAAMQFEEATPEYFAAVLRECAARAVCATYWLDDRLVAFNLLLHDGRCLLDKFVGMDYAVARRYNLYFYTWIENVRFCIARGVALYQSGQGLHREKLRLGSRLTANWLWYRHRNRVIDAIFASVERIASLDRHDPELAALIEQSK